jgi:hypothetical protein
MHYGRKIEEDRVSVNEIERERERGRDRKRKRERKIKWLITKYHMPQHWVFLVICKGCVTLTKFLGHVP